MYDIVLTFDMDWAPDFVMKETIELLINHRCKSTWFVTHNTKLLSKMREYPDLFELGIHPNFMPESSHGSNFQQVMQTVMKIVPEAKSVRSHALFYCHYLLDIYLQYGIKYDSSISLNLDPFIIPIKVHTKNGSLVRIPFYWADCIEPFGSKYFLNDSGLKIFVFHPIHVFLNSINSLSYELIKKKYNDISQCPEKFARLYVSSKKGIRDILEDLIQYSTKTIREVGEESYV